MSRGAPAAACTGWRSGWRSRSTAPLGAEGRSSATGITPGRSRRRGTCGPAWSMCSSTSASISAPPRASIRGARRRTFRGGVTPQWRRTSRRPRPCHTPGWRASDGGAAAGRCGWKNTRLPRPDRTRLEFRGCSRRGRRTLVGRDFGGYRRASESVRGM
jgi:hypothetical protein